jgi:hypothetical protein
MAKRQGKSGTIDVKAVVAEDKEFVRALVRMTLQEVLEAEMTEALGAEKGERASGRQGQRPGYYGRTRIGRLELRVPQSLPRRRPGTEPGGSRPNCSSDTSVWSGRWWRRWRRCMCEGFRPAKACPCDGRGEGDHRGVMRPQLFGFIDQYNELATGRGSGAIRRPPVGRSLPLSDPRRARRAGTRGRRDRQPSGADSVGIDWCERGRAPRHQSRAAG